MTFHTLRLPFCHLSLEKSTKLPLMMPRIERPLASAREWVLSTGRFNVYFTAGQPQGC